MSRHVQNTDSSVLERRLRPIYDWLDTGNNKKALQECDKVLKKTPTLQCAKALKALTLYRMGKEPESKHILNALTQEQTTDEATLQAMTLCYREMQELDKICELYKEAVKLEPSNEELHTHLFMSYVRISDFKMQQISALALYKQKPKNPYYCWVIMSIVLQATRGEGLTDPAKKTLLLNLAERMMMKMVDDNKIDAEQEIQLLIMILDLLGKYQDILCLLEDPDIKEKLQCTPARQMKVDYLARLDRWSELNFLCKIILHENIDNWSIWKCYIGTVFEIYGPSINGDNHHKLSNNIDLYIIDNTPEKCHEFICSMIESISSQNSYSLRGPYLARFELCLKLKKHGHTNHKELLGDTTALFIEYFRKFGHKPCCVADLKIYLQLLDEEQRIDLSTKLVKDVGINATSVPQSAEQMQKHIGALQLSRLCGSHRNLSSDHLKALVTALTLHYQHGSQSYEKNLLPTDLGPSDHYAILAAHVLYDLTQQEKNCDSLLLALIALESLLKNSPSNFHAKLLALKLYHTVGDGVDANNMFQSLDVKQIQLDSLGYIHCGRLATTGLFSLCTLHFDNTLKFFATNYKDSTDHLTFSYKFGSFTKLEEFMDFREKMNNSLHYTTTVVDRIMISIMDCSNVEALYNLDISPRDNKIDWDKLRDNRDANVYIHWEPDLLSTSLDQCQVVKDLCVHDMNFLKLRTRILWALSSTIEIVKSLDGTRQKCIENLRDILKEWKELRDDIAKSHFSKSVKEDLVVYPLPSRLHATLETPYLSVISTFLEFFICLATDNTSSAEKLVKAIEEEIDGLKTFLERKTVQQSTDFREKRKSMEFAVNTVEIICVCSVICLMCNELTKSHNTRKGKRKPDNQRFKDFVSTIVTKLKSDITSMSDIIEMWIAKCEVRDLVSMIETLNLQMNSDCLHRNIMLSYELANKEIQTVLKCKIKSLSNL